MSASGGTSGQIGTPVGSSATGANAALTATLAAVAGKTNYLTGFEVTGEGATAGGSVQVTVTGVTGAPLQYTFAIPTGVAVGAAPLIVPFNPPLPATAPNTQIQVAVPAFGAGNPAASVVAHGYVA
jgi:hypothetical protein